jgi:hypothetical protein
MTETINDPVVIALLETAEIFALKYEKCTFMYECPCSMTESLVDRLLSSPDENFIAITESENHCVIRVEVCPILLLIEV